MNFREHFEAWHKKQYGYVGQYTGTAMCITYRTTACQQRWEGWQACADWHTQQEVAKQLEYTVKHPNGAPKFSSTTFRDDGVPIMLNPDGTRSIFCDIDQ